MTTITRRIFKALTFAPVVILVGYIVCAILIHPVFLVPAVFYSKFVFKFENDQLYVFGKLYVIVRRDQRILRIGSGIMHQTSSPWYKGRGIYVVFFKKCTQVGFCKPQQLSEESGILSAMQGRYLDLTPHEIGNWNAVPKGSKAGTTPTA